MKISEFPSAASFAAYLEVHDGVESGIDYDKALAEIGARDIPDSHISSFTEVERWVQRMVSDSWHTPEGVAEKIMPPRFNGSINELSGWWLVTGGEGLLINEVRDHFFADCFPEYYE